MSDGPLVRITPAAAAKVIELSADDPRRSYLHVYFAGQGCCRSLYRLAFLPDADAEYEVIESFGVKIAVSAASRKSVAGVAIDFVQTPQGEGFTVLNPAAAAGGGCACH